MALKDYYELSAMLRMQLPILLSFAVLRCFMGAALKFWARKLVPARLQALFKPVSDATHNTLFFMYAALLMAALFYSAMSYSVWSATKNSQQMLVCTEFSNTRVNGIISAIGLLALFTSSDPMVHALSLATLKSVADGSISGLFLAALTWSAAASAHNKAPWVFFGTTFGVNIVYSSLCYSDDKNANLSGGTVLASSMAALLIGVRIATSGFHNAWNMWVRMRRDAYSRIAHAAKLLYERFRTPPPAITHAHEE